MRTLPCTAAQLASSLRAPGGALDEGIDLTVVMLGVGIVLAVGLILAAVHRAIRRRRSLREGRSTRSV
jgi:Na+-transporting methylmalonyl-CoA/oxaloacetate decarboxylase gamma subunit